MSFELGARARRGLVIGALAVTVAGLALVACFDPSEPLGGLTAESTPAGAPADNLPQHTHRATIPLSDINSPPSGGATYVTDTNQDHSHTVVLTQAQLGYLQQRGGVVSLTTGDGPGNHQHGITFVR